MGLTKMRIAWLFRLWPLFVLVATTAGVMHWANWTPPPTAMAINKIAGANLLGTGATLVLVSINSNLELFRGHGIVAEFRRYLSAWPRRAQNVTLIGASCGQVSMSGALASVRVTASR